MRPSPLTDLSAVLAFRTVAATRSFTMAAQQLRITLSAVSRQVARLEDNLGVQLIQRTTRALQLTEAGQIFYEHCLRGLEELEQGVAVISQLQSTPHGLLRVIATYSFGRLHVVPALIDFMKSYPEVSVDISLSHAESSFLGNQAEILIRSSPVRGGSVSGQKIATFRNVICATPDYIGRHGKPKKPHELASHTCLIMTQPVLVQEWPFIRGGRKQHVAVSGGVRANTMDTLYQAVMAGIGIARIPDYVVRPELRSGALVQLFPNFGTDAAMYAYYIKGRYADPKTQAFMAFLQARFDQSYDWERRPASL